MPRDPNRDDARPTRVHPSTDRPGEAALEQDRPVEAGLNTDSRGGPGSATEARRGPTEPGADSGLFDSRSTEPRSGTRIGEHGSQGLAGAQGSGGGAERGIAQRPGRRDDAQASEPGGAPMPDNGLGSEADAAEGDDGNGDGDGD